MDDVLPALADRNRAAVTRLTGAAFRKALRQWERVEQANIAASWASLMPAAATAVGVAQYAAGIDSAAMGLTAMDVQGIDSDGDIPDPAGVVGVMPETGAALDGALAGVAYHALDRIGAGVEPGSALASGRFELADLVQQAVAGAGSAMAGVTTASRTRTVGWTRVARPGCCPRCSVLAGRFYRWNKGFERHPRCRCVHIPSRENIPGSLESDPYQLFAALPESEQNRIWTQAGAQAIRDGGDIYQVANSMQKRKPAARRSPRRRFTTEGSSRRGAYRRYSTAGQAGKRRLTVGEIYRRAGDDRAAARRLLKEYGYLFDEGQIVGGVLRGDVEGFGQFGRGGASVGAREAVERARRTGVRDPQSRYTMTAAELRAWREKHPRTARR